MTTTWQVKGIKGIDPGSCKSGKGNLSPFDRLRAGRGAADAGGNKIDLNQIQISIHIDIFPKTV
jgi:hypothetical protein